MTTPSVEVAIVGAGTAGATAAALCARRGLSVLCVDRRPLDEAGARWINDVPLEAFDAAGVARPEAPELFGTAHDFHLLAGWGPRRVVIRDAGIVGVDMRALVARLQATARDAGATLRGSTDVHGFDGQVLETSAGPVRARWFVDASGVAGARLLGQRAVPREDLCAAAQGVYALRDADAARAYFRAHGTGPGDILCFSGVAGGYSIVNLRLVDDRLAVLTGSIPAEGNPSGQELLQRFVDQHAWVGAREFGGARVIPLGLPQARLADGATAALGDAAGQVFTAHGSGIGAGMLAARVLADALADGRGVQGYAVDWQRRHGGLLASYDLFRRLAQRLDATELDGMMAHGLLDEPMARAGLEQRWPPLSPGAVLGRVRGMSRAPELARALGRLLPRMFALRALHRVYPRDARRVAAWVRWRDRAAGAAPARV